MQRICLYKVDSSFGYRTDECDLTITLKKPEQLNAGTNFDAANIVTYVTKLRNHENDRIMDVARYGFELVVEDDEKKLQKFLKL